MKKRKLEEEKLITNFVPEREAFIEKQHRVKRLFSNELGKPANYMDPGRQSLDEFLKANKIHPKIFTADTYQAQEKSLSTVKTTKPNINKKHSHI